MKTGNEHIKAWLGRMRRIVSRTLPGHEEAVRWSPEVVRAEQLEFEFQRPRSLRAGLTEVR